MSPSAIRSRSFATEEAKPNLETSAELSENEKKLTIEVETLTKEVETLTEKNKELDVSRSETTSGSIFIHIFNDNT